MVTVIQFIAWHFDLSIDSLADYDWGGRTSERHRARIRTQLGFTPWSNADGDRLKAYLVKTVAPREASRETVREDALAWYREQRIEPLTLVIETDSHGVDRVNRINYEIVVLEAPAHKDTLQGDLGRRCRSLLQSGQGPA